MMYGKIMTSAPKTPTKKAAPSVPFGVVRRPQTPTAQPIRVAGVGCRPPASRQRFYGNSLFL